MRIGILECGDVPPYLAEPYGDYPAMFRRLLTAEDPSLDFVTIRSVAGEMPEGPHQADAWIVTGSRHGVYDDLPFIEPLKAFLREVVAAHVPLAGICFGHQIIAEALGGHAEKSERGWGIGRQDYPIRTRPAWMTGSADSYSGLAVHQDQVTALPEGATVLAGSEFCPMAAVAYGDPERPDAITVQSHPEFVPGVVRAIIEDRRGSVIPEARAAAGIASLETPAPGNPWPVWILGYFRAAAVKSAA